jgi:hypothetical protein
MALAVGAGFIPARIRRDGVALPNPDSTGAADTGGDKPRPYGVPPNIDECQF